MEINLDVTITLNDDGIEMSFLHPESGDHITYDFPYSPDEHPEFNETVGNELYSWVNLKLDEMEDR